MGQYVNKKNEVPEKKIPDLMGVSYKVGNKVKRVTVMQKKMG